MKGKDFNSVKPYVYFIKDKKTNIKYFGVRWANVPLNRTPSEDLGKYYFSSGVLEKAFRKNPDNFKIKLIATFDTAEEARDYESLQNKKNIRKKRYANTASFPTIVHTQESLKNLSEKLTGRKLSKEHIRNMSEAKKRENLSVETLKKMSLASQNQSEERRRKISEALRGRKRGPETGRKISEKLTGRKLSKEHIRKMSEVRRGKKASEETRRKLSILHTGRKMSAETKRKIGLANRKKRAKEN